MLKFSRFLVRHRCDESGTRCAVFVLHSNVGSVCLARRREYIMRHLHGSAFENVVYQSVIVPESGDEMKRI